MWLILFLNYILTFFHFTRLSCPLLIAQTYRHLTVPSTDSLAMPIERALESAAVSLVLKKVVSQETIDFFFKWDLDRPLLEKLRRTLLVIQAVLNHADERQIDDEHVKEWLDQVRAATYDAEDILADIATKALESQSSQNQVRNFIYDSFGASGSTKEAIDFKMKDVAAYLNPFKEQIDSKLKSLIERLEDLAKQKDILRLREDVKGNSSAMYKRSPTTPLVNMSQVYGREVEKMEIIEKITSNTVEVDHDFRVVPIVGMGGVGKTTLAQIVFNDEGVKKHFELQAWVCVSDEFNVTRITQLLIESATQKSCELKNLELLQDKLKTLLSKKKFLLVLDDVWNENYGNWEDLQLPFGVGSPGSSIIVTTRNEKVASTIVGGGGPFYNLKELSKDDCWLLLEHIAFPRRNSYAYPKLKAMNEEMVKKCKGLPLAAKILGGLLRLNLDESHWKDILQSQLWDKPSNNILPVLRLSYHHLPPYLKRCFAYCSLFPKDYEFDVETLVLLWMAEGFVNEPGKNKSIEDEGYDYFHELLSRSFFQQVARCSSRFVMHDLIHDLAKFVSSNLCVRLEDTVDDDKKSDMLLRARHLSYFRIFDEHDMFPKFKPFYMAQKLRTFLPLDHLDASLGLNMYYISSKVVDHLLPKLISLRVLSLRGYNITSLPDSISSLKQLHYLDLSRCTIEELPESTSRLYNLQTLLLVECRHLKKLPANMGSLVNLRHLVTDGSSLQMMPPHMGRLKLLQKLSNFIVTNEEGSSIGQLKELQHLRGKVHISGLENVTHLTQAIQARLKLKQHLEELIYEWARDDCDTRNEILEEQVLEALQPHGNLTKLTIKYYGGTEFPSWIGDPLFTKMVYVHIYGCAKSVSLPSLGQLPLLKELIIEGMDEVKLIGPEFYDDSSSSFAPFGSLEILKFQNMKVWKEWVFPEDVEGLGFPQLRELAILRCPKLIRFCHPFPSLEILRIKQCAELVTFSQVPSSGISVEEFPLLRELIIEGCTKLNQLPCPLASLKRLEIDGCQQLDALPELVKLEDFYLTGSNMVLLDRLVELRSLTTLQINHIPMMKCLPNGFMQGSTKLQTLAINACADLDDLSSQYARLVNLASLKSLTVSHCPKLITLPSEAKQLPPLLECLDMRYCCNLRELTKDLYSLVCLTELRIEHCPGLVCFPEEGLPPLLRRLVIHGCNVLKTLPEKTFSNNVSLEILEIRLCSSLESVIHHGDLPATLKSMSILHCKNLKLLPSVMFNKDISLQFLELDNCCSLESFPEGQLPRTLLRLEIIDCQNLKSLPATLVNLVNLEQLAVSGCSVLEHLPSGKWHTINLKRIRVDACEKLKSLPDCFHRFRSLQDLEVRSCCSLASMPKLGLPTNLKFLAITDCNSINPMRQWKLHKLTSLTRLVICGLPGQVSFANDCPLPYSIIELHIGDFPDLETLPEGIGSLSRLQTLVLKNCNKLNALPEEGLPATLCSLGIINCALLESRCRKGGEDWSKIADIPFVMVE